LDVPLRERNALLLAAGYAPAYGEEPLDAAAMGAVAGALRRMLRQHEPFPALVLDRYWNVLLTNDYAPRLFNRFVDLAARPRPRNLLHLMFDPAGMRPFIVNWEEVAAGLFDRVRREAVGHVLDAETEELLAALAAYPGVDPARLAGTRQAAALPMIPIRFRKDGQVLSYFSMVATVGTPGTVTAQELRLECMFPADDETEARHLALVGASRDG
ncbi:MAG: transcriptional regulator, partial [Gluconacetobacter diazotrophicus]|nr:transcriptional regulator [Gluconacetobacter diazotrophicus]